MTDHLAHLRAYIERDQHASHASRRPRRGRLLDAGGHDRFFRIPAPRQLARLLVAELLQADVEAFRRPDGAIVARAHGSTDVASPIDRESLTARVVDVLRTMPELPWSPTHEAYTYVRTFAELAPPAELKTYAGEAIAALSGSTSPLPMWQPPKAARPKSTKTRADYSADERSRVESDRIRNDAEVRALLLDRIPQLAPGRYRLDSIWASWQADPDRARLIGRTRFYAELDDLFDVQPGGARRRYLVIASTTTETKEHDTVNTAESIREYAAAQRDAADATYNRVQAEEQLLDVESRRFALQREQLAAGGRAGALHTQAERLATGTDGAPVDLGAYRAARAG